MIFAGDRTCLRVNFCLFVLLYRYMTHQFCIAAFIHESWVGIFSSWKGICLAPSKTPSSLFTYAFNSLLCLVKHFPCSPLWLCTHFYSVAVMVTFDCPSPGSNTEFASCLETLTPYHLTPVRCFWMSAPIPKPMTTAREFAKKKKIHRKSKSCPGQCLYYRQGCNMNPCYPAFSNNPQINSTPLNPDNTNCHWLILNMQAEIKLVQVWGTSDL